MCKTPRDTRRADMCTLQQLLIEEISKRKWKYITVELLWLVLWKIFFNESIKLTVKIVEFSSSSKWRIRNQPVVLAEVFVEDSAAVAVEEAVVEAGDGVVEGVKPRTRRYRNIQNFCSLKYINMVENVEGTVNIIDNFPCLNVGG